MSRQAADCKPRRRGARTAGRVEDFARELERLNAEQRAVVAHGAECADGGPALLVVAGAGTGKTDTLAHRVARLIAGGALPEQILLLTFSRRAAEEMRSRVTRLLRRCGLGEAQLDWAGTFHAVGARLLRDYAGVIGLSASFTIADRDDAADLMGLLRQELELGDTRQRFPTRHTCLAIYSRVVNTGKPLQAVLAQHFPWCAGWDTQLRRLFGAYAAAKQSDQVLDYDDLLLYWEKMLEAEPLAQVMRERFRYVLVDEYQDTNRLQARLLAALRPAGRGLTAVGDDAQSIYAFRGAEIDNMLHFARDFPQAATLTLTRNYRSTAPLLEASNAVIAESVQRLPKRLWTEQPGGGLPALVSVADETAQAEYAAQQVLARRDAGETLRQQAILFRTGHHSAALEVVLNARQIPYRKFGGLKFLDTSHVRDLLAVLRFALNPRERVAGFRVLQLLPGVGPAIAAQTIEAIAQARLDAGPGFVLPTPRREPPDWAALASLLGTLAKRTLAPGAALEQAVDWYAPFLARRFDDPEPRLEDLYALARIAQTYASLERFLTDLVLDPADAASDQAGDPWRDDDYLVLSTIHSAKGREWRHVTLLNAVDGCLPADLSTGSAAEIEEERRLLYVAMTRAKETLDLVVPLRFHVRDQASAGDRHVYAQRSRFLPPKLLRLFENRAWPPPAKPSAAGAEALAALRLDIASKLRAMWDD